MKNSLFNKLPYALSLTLVCLLVALVTTACNKDAQITESKVTPAPTYTAPVYEPSPEAVVHAAAGMLLDEYALCESISNNAPVGEASTFYADGSRVYLYTKIEMEQDESDYIRHIWYHEGKEMNNVKLDVRGPSHRTNSYKTMFEGLDGDWQVDVVASNGDLINSIEFTVL